MFNLVSEIVGCFWSLFPFVFKNKLRKKINPLVFQLISLFVLKHL